ncbi:gas vesicle protein [Kribbella pratensis]|uniref:Gas vesicle protein GvpA/GvpJ/GvpM family n=1 Tax=Kribbella pratensis TaxID=2512112 RepID=A0A4R8C2U6_9ACTN|nr:gas vesicle protein [Kribbella pratensis]TDW69395.1 gas vesicle protein GvpA/GvpJ/GvpM family [Kribbella pratensis]
MNEVDARLQSQPISVVDLLDRLLGTGVVLAGEVVISMAGVDLVQVHLAAVIRTVTDELETMR